jgi:hypothetical protein
METEAIIIDIPNDLDFNWLKTQFEKDNDFGNYKVFHENEVSFDDVFSCQILESSPLSIAAYIVDPNIDPNYQKIMKLSSILAFAEFVGDINVIAIGEPNEAEVTPFAPLINRIKKEHKFKSVKDKNFLKYLEDSFSIDFGISSIIEEKELLEGDIESLKKRTEELASELKDKINELKKLNKSLKDLPF